MNDITCISICCERSCTILHHRAAWCSPRETAVICRHLTKLRNLLTRYNSEDRMPMALGLSGSLSFPSTLKFDSHIYVAHFFLFSSANTRLAMRCRFSLPWKASRVLTSRKGFMTPRLQFFGILERRVIRIVAFIEMSSLVERSLKVFLPIILLQTRLTSVA